MKLDLAPPRDWQSFEDLCRDLWAELWGDPNAQKHGRSGQKQRGVDVFGQPAGGAGWEGVQCKRYGRQLTRMEIEHEVAEARAFEPRLQRLIVATTAKRDTGAQELVREISDAEVARESFPVSLWAWDDIADEIVKYRDLFRRYYPALPLPPVPGAPGDRPFEAFKPVVPPWFVGRKRALYRLESALGSRDGVSIVGDGKIGKSSLLRTWQWKLRHSGRKVCLVDGQGAAGGSEAAFVGAVIGRPAPEGADPAADALAAWAAGEPEGLAPVVLVDELDHLPGRFDPRFFERLRNLLGRIVLVVASRREVDPLPPAGLDLAVRQPAASGAPRAARRAGGGGSDRPRRWGPQWGGSGSDAPVGGPASVLPAAPGPCSGRGSRTRREPRRGARSPPRSGRPASAGPLGAPRRGGPGSASRRARGQAAVVKPLIWRGLLDAEGRPFGEVLAAWLRESV